MKTKVRASKISIESPKPDSETWVHIEVAQLIYDDNNKLVNIIPRYDYISKPITELLKDTYSTGEVKITGLEVMQIITTVVITWMAEKYKVAPDSGGDIWLS